MPDSRDSPLTLTQLQTLLEQSETALARLLEESTQNQQQYRDDAGALLQCHEQINLTKQVLHEQLDARVVRQQLDRLSQQISKSWLSNQISAAISEFVQHNQRVMHDLQEQIDGYRQSLHKIYNRFHLHHGIGLIQPKPYSLQPALLEFNNIMAHAGEFDHSLKLIANSTESLQERFKENIGEPCNFLFESVRQDVTQWLDQSLQPLDLHMSDQQQQLGKLLDELKASQEAREILAAHLEKIKANQQTDDKSLT